jgi:hypothetical protein
VTGICREGYFVATDGDHAGVKFSSANQAVNTIREPSSNAFLFVHFLIDDHWIVADDLRRRDDLSYDEVEEYALDWITGVFKDQAGNRHVSDVELRRKAAERIAAKPTLLQTARQTVEIGKQQL